MNFQVKISRRIVLLSILIICVLNQSTNLIAGSLSDFEKSVNKKEEKKEENSSGSLLDFLNIFGGLFFSHDDKSESKRPKHHHHNYITYTHNYGFFKSVETIEREALYKQSLNHAITSRILSELRNRRWLDKWDRFSVYSKNSDFWQERWSEPLLERFHLNIKTLAKRKKFQYITYNDVLAEVKRSSLGHKSWENIRIQQSGDKFELENSDPDYQDISSEIKFSLAQTQPAVIKNNLLGDVFSYAAATLCSFGYWYPLAIANKDTQNLVTVMGLTIPMLLPKVALPDTETYGLQRFPFQRAQNGILIPNGDSWRLWTKFSLQKPETDMTNFKLQTELITKSRFVLSGTLRCFTEGDRYAKDYLYVGDGLLNYIFAQNESWHFSAGLGVQTIKGKYESTALKAGYNVTAYLFPVKLKSTIGYAYHANPVFDWDVSISLPIQELEFSIGYSELATNSVKINGWTAGFGLWF